MDVGEPSVQPRSVHGKHGQFHDRLFSSSMLSLVSTSSMTVFVFRNQGCCRCSASPHSRIIGSTVAHRQTRSSLPSAPQCSIQLNRKEKETKRKGDKKKRRQKKRRQKKRRQKEKETKRKGDKKKRRQKEKETKRKGDKKKRRQKEEETKEEETKRRGDKKKGDKKKRRQKEKEKKGRGKKGRVFAVFLLCVLRTTFPSRSNQTMGCAHAWMSGREYESSLSMSRLVYRLKTSAVLWQCGWSGTNTPPDDGGENYLHLAS